MSRRRRNKRVKRFGAHGLHTAWWMGTLWLLHQAVLWITGLPWPVLAISALVIMIAGRRIALGALLLVGFGLLASPTVVLALGGASIVIGLVVRLRWTRAYLARVRKRILALARRQQASDRVPGLIAASFTVPDTTRPLGVDSRHQSIVDDYLRRIGSAEASVKVISGAPYRRIERHLSERAEGRVPPAVAARAARVVDAHFSAPDLLAEKVITGDQYRRIERHLPEDAEPRVPPTVTAHAARVVDAHFSAPDLLARKVITGDQYRRIERHLPEDAEPRVPPTVAAHAARVVDAHFSAPDLLARKVITGDQYRRIERHLPEDAEPRVPPAVAAHAARVVDAHFSAPDLLAVFDRLPSHARHRYLRTVRAHVVR